MSVLRRILRRVAAFPARLVEWRAKREDRPVEPTPQAPHVQAQANHADERTIRRIAQDGLGGTSSAESREAYLRGDNPGGLHRGGHGPAPRERGEDDEPVNPSRDTLTSAPSPSRH